MSKYRYSIFNVYFKTSDFYIIFNTLSGVCIKSKDFNMSFPPENLIDKQIVVDSTLDEIAKLRVLIQKSTSRSKVRNFFIAPTMKCNFNCSYCYAPKRNTVMSAKTGTAVIEFILKSLDEFSAVSLTWLGGEPLLNKDLIIMMSKEFSNKIKIVETNTIVTNGLLLDKNTANKLSNAGVSDALVTLDGMSVTHNNRRKSEMGNGSFEIIMNNIRSCLNILNITLRINVDGQNIDELERFVSALIDDVQLKNVNISLVPVQPFTKNAIKMSGDIIDHCVIDEMSRLSRAYINVSLGGPDPVFHTCAGMNINDYSIGDDGLLYVCPVGIGHRDFVVGSIFDCVPTSEYYSWHSHALEIPTKCYECAYLPICKTDCMWISKSEVGVQLNATNCQKKIKYFRTLIMNHIAHHMSEDIKIYENIDD